MKASEVKEGLAVILLPFETEPQQEAVCLSEKPCKGTIIVSLLPEYVTEMDDGIREVPLNQVKVK